MRVAARRRAYSRSLSCLLAAGCLFAAFSGTARADVFGPISLLSTGSVAGGPTLQADYAHDAVISADGRYVVFDGSVAGVTGVWRRAVATGALEQVAGGDAEMPSVSANGQYISFTTNEGVHLPEITQGQPDRTPLREAVQVYVRNMSLPVSPTQAREEELGPMASERAFVAASATCTANPLGCGEPPRPLRYTAGSSPTSEGSYAAGRSAISADGTEVVFVTGAASNLVAYPEQEAKERAAGEVPVPHTPALQVAVRHLDSNRTELVSRCYFHCSEAADGGASEPVVGSGALGALLPGPATFPSVPPNGAWTGATISADGSTVAWMGENVAEQAPELAAEELPPQYTEPLWRRIAPGSETATERVTGGSQGPFEQPGGSPVSGIWPSGASGVGDFIPRLSADGYTVAFAAEAALVGRRTHSSEGQNSDVYVASMRPGLTRTQALTPLSEIGTAGLAAEAPIADFEVSPDGTQVAFATVRTSFFLGSPAFVSPTAAQPGIAELFDADLATATLTRVTHGFNGGASEQTHPPTLQVEEDPYGSAPIGLGALSPSFTGDGHSLAFTSTAGNLVYGDGNTPEAPSTEPENGSDAFLVTHESFVPVSTQQYVSPSPVTSTEPEWRLGATAISQADGSVVLYVRVPGEGRLSAGADSTVLIRPARASRSGRRGRRAPRPGRSRVVARRAVARSEMLVASATGGLVTLKLVLARPYAALALRRGGLSASLRVAFAARGEPTLKETLLVSFHRVVRARRTRARR